MRTPEMAGMSGIHQEYFSIIDTRYDLLVEAEVAAVTAVVTEVPAMLGATSFRIESDVPAGSDGSQESLVRIYRLGEQSWTQVFCPSSAKKPFELGKYVSERLAARCLQIEMSDDAWGGHVLFDRGAVKEISCYCVGDDLRRLCPRLGLPVPDMDDDEIYEEIEHFQSELSLDRDADELPGLVEHLGLWVDAGGPVWDAAQKVAQLDLLFAS